MPQVARRRAPISAVEPAAAIAPAIALEPTDLGSPPETIGYATEPMSLSANMALRANGS